MHELGIAQSIVEIACEYARGARVRRVSLEIGQLTAISADAIEFCFEACCLGTVLEGASLEIREIPCLARCRSCGADVPLEQPFGICGCGSSDLQFIQGDELKLKELETEEEICV
jgi:hydrogenase nickel incorporation protein HypA/HybF